MNRSISFSVVAFAALLAACGGTAPQSAGTIATPKPKAESYEWVGRDKVGKAIALLNTGDAPGARKLLIAVLNRQPSDAVAASLVKQIDTNPKALLGAESFAYTAREGDSFSSLAQRFLGSPTMFYALARYNDVAAPGTLARGTPLRIPGHEKRETPPAVAHAEPAPRVAAETPRPAPPPKPAAPHADPRRAALLRAQGLEQMNRGAIVRAVALLEQASRLDPANPLIKRDLDRAVRIRRTVQASR
jgi:LysM repeat protein